MIDISKKFYKLSTNNKIKVVLNNIPNVKKRMCCNYNSLLKQLT